VPQRDVNKLFMILDQPPRERRHRDRRG
jgi:hypothetical protein